jgi:hypothetical protein
MRRVAFFLLAGLLGIVPVACGGSGDNAAATAGGQTSGAGAKSTIVQAASRTAASSSARFSFTASLSGGAVEGSWSGEGAFAGAKGRMLLDLSGLGTGAGAFAGGKTEVVTDGLVAYVKVPPSLVQALPQKKAWLKLDLAKLGEAQGIDLAQLMQFNQSNPNGVLRYLRGATEDFEAVGEEDVRGVETTHYRGTIDLRAVASHAPPAARKSYERIIEISGMSHIPMEAWIDDDGLARRLRYEQPLGHGQGKVALTMELYDFGVEVAVRIPPEQQALDLMELIGGTR